MGKDDYSSLERELRSIQHSGVQLNSSKKSAKISATDYISAGIATVITWLILYNLDLSWLKTKSGNKNIFLIFLLGVIVGIGVGTAVFFLYS